MKFTRSSLRHASTQIAAIASLMLAPAVGAAQQQGQLQFRSPSAAKKSAAPSTSAPLAFRSVRVASAPQPEAKPAPVASAPANAVRTPQPQLEVQQADYQQPAKPLPAPRAAAPAVRVAAKPQPAAPAPTMTSAHKVTTSAVDIRAVAPAHRAAPPHMGPTVAESVPLDVEEASYYPDGECASCTPECGMCDTCCEEVACGCAEPVCGCAEPMCGCVDAGCGFEESCGCAEPDCGCVSCGSCVGNPGPDYWCFPVCLPRLKELTIWGGAHGFKGPRDYLDGGPGDNNFGFHEGLNIGGRAPLVGLILPQVSYQLGYQAAQSRLSGTSGGSEDRNQHFVTGGFFRRVRSGVQGGIVFDMMRDDLIAEEDFHQLRYEVSLKSGNGREIGYWGCSSTNSKTVGAFEFQTVEQHALFFRLNFRDGGALRIWGGGTDNSEGIVGADFMAPLSSRWSVATGFNYLIPDAVDGPQGAAEEAWNVGLSLVWHWGATGKAGSNNPHAPLFPVADNGWMFINTQH